MDDVTLQSVDWLQGSILFISTMILSQASWRGGLRNKVTCWLSSGFVRLSLLIIDGEEVPLHQAQRRKWVCCRDSLLVASLGVKLLDINLQYNDSTLSTIAIAAIAIGAIVALAVVAYL